MGGFENFSGLRWGGFCLVRWTLAVRRNQLWAREWACLPVLHYPVQTVPPAVIWFMKNSQNFRNCDREDFLFLSRYFWSFWHLALISISLCWCATVSALLFRILFFLSLVKVVVSSSHHCISPPIKSSIAFVVITSITTSSTKIYSIYHKRTRCNLHRHHIYSLHRHRISTPSVTHTHHIVRSSHQWHGNAINTEQYTSYRARYQPCLWARPENER